MNSLLATSLLRELDVLLEPWAKKHNLKLEKPKGSYSSTDIGIRFKLIEDTPEAKEKKEGNLKMACMLMGLKESPIGKEITFGGTKYRVLDIKPERRKYPIVAARLDTGTKYKLPASAVQDGR